MKTYLEIKSFGEIDVQAFTLIGASTKREDSTKIGLYGSGNKYSIAALLRQGVDFKVFSGEDEVVFTTVNRNFRDQNFDVILVNGQETSLTTTMGGSDWDSAFAPIREIYSNAMDEDEDAKISKTTNIIAEKGYTKFFIEMNEEVEHFYKNLHLYFCNHNPKPLFSNTVGTIYSNIEKTVTRVFRKGILSHKDDKQASVFHYNFEDLDINESRVVKYVWQINGRIGEILKSCTNKDIINTLLLTLEGGNDGYIEHKADWSTWRSFTEEWGEVCSNKKFAPVEFLNMFSEEELKGAYKLPMKMLKELKTQFNDLNVLGISSNSNATFVSVKPSQILIDKVIDAIGVLNRTRYKHRMDNPQIEYVKFSDDSVLGLAENGKIYLSIKHDCRSVDEIAKIIIEENEHNYTGFGDETRAFQDHLFNLYYDELIK